MFVRTVIPSAVGDGAQGQFTTPKNRFLPTVVARVFSRGKLTVLDGREGWQMSLRTAPMQESADSQASGAGGKTRPIAVDRRCALQLTVIRGSCSGAGTAYKHLVYLHLTERVRDATNAKSRLPEAGKRHPVDAKRGVVVDHHRRPIESRVRMHRQGEIAREYRRLECDRQRVRAGDGFIE